jgi:hypothetical protein
MSHSIAVQRSTAQLMRTVAAPKFAVPITVSNKPCLMHHLKQIKTTRFCKVLLFAVSRTQQTSESSTAAVTLALQCRCWAPCLQAAPATKQALGRTVHVPCTNGCIKARDRYGTHSFLSWTVCCSSCSGLVSDTVHAAVSGEGYSLCKQHRT